MEGVSGGDWIGQMIERLGIFARSTAEMVRLGDIWVCANEVPKILAAYSSPFVEYTQVRNWEVSFCGTATTLKLKSRHFILCCAHQLRNRNLEYCGVLADYPDRYVTGGVYFSTSEEDLGNYGDLCDIVAFDCSDAVGAGALSPSIFFQNFGHEFLRTGERVIGAIVIGYPNSAFDFEIEDDEEFGSNLAHVHVGKVALACEYRGNSYEPYLFCLKAKGESEKDLAGFSGSPVFLVCGKYGDYYIKCAGMVMRGGNGIFHCMKHTTIRRYLLQAVDQ